MCKGAPTLGTAFNRLTHLTLYSSHQLPPHKPTARLASSNTLIDYPHRLPSSNTLISYPHHNSHHLATIIIHISYRPHQAAWGTTCSSTSLLSQPHVLSAPGTCPSFVSRAAAPGLAQFVQR